MMKLHLFALLLFPCLLVGCKRPTSQAEIARVVEGGGKDVASDDAAMNRAIAEAQSTSEEFLKAFRDNKPGTDEFMVKKPYGSPSGRKEHMWIAVTGEKNGILQGVVMNEPDYTNEVKLEQRVSLNISEITDWKYLKGKKMIGGYTIRYYLNTLSPEEQKVFLKSTGTEL